MAFDGVLIVLVDDALDLLLELGVRLRVPPVHVVPILVVLLPLVIEPVSDFVSDEGPNGSEVQVASSARI